MRIIFQVLGTDTGDITPSFVVLFDQKTFLFNCGEGTQRIINQLKIKITKIDHIFFNSLNWELIGGFAGSFDLHLSDYFPKI